MGEGLLPLDPPEMPAALDNPARAGCDQGCLRRARPAPRRTPDRRHRCGDAGTYSWPAAGRVVDDWIAALRRGTNDLEVPAARIEPVISDAAVRALRTTVQRSPGSACRARRDLL